jgi:hypothetical protein
MIPFNANVSDLSSTLEGATVTIQCEEGLPINITCTNTGQWIPNPSGLQCITEVSSTTPVMSEANTHVLSTTPVVSETNTVCTTSTPAGLLEGIVGGS